MARYTLEQRILKRWEILKERERNDGRRWYPRARRMVREMARELELSPYVMAGVVAALSPQNNWDTFNKRTRVRGYPNLKCARKAVALFTYSNQFTCRGCHLPVQEKKAERILAGERPMDVLRGPKVQAFYHNLAYPHSRRITVDRWAWRVATLDEYKSGFTAKKLQPVADAYVKVAEQVDELPLSVQAGTWLHIRSNG